ncbi:hypothetical protein [Pajaroellobacter abortibovis]|uniref:Uncharacterized protein n=1 Tax=Pajaroellobacter abortibovis TaxID=1882918 RepID=A0A1L6MYK9_9BACT|nr:hypothetical protein [Pajaroellobacter abortibovis]APS00586.1 hypothetical protein BCY86_07800 [Pajaroellobacter abortibovis]
MGYHCSWPELQENKQFQGRWVALQECKYDAKTSQLKEGNLIDSDEDFVKLCSRMKKENQRHCTILFCTQDKHSGPIQHNKANQRTPIVYPF